MVEDRKIVKVSFWDHVETSGEHSVSEVKETMPVQCVVYGEVVKETSDFVTVLCLYEKPPGDKSFKAETYAMTILKSTIVERKQLIPKP